MNNFSRYTFSPDVKNNLADFLRIVQRNPSNSHDKIWGTLLPTNQSLIKELNEHLSKNESVIDLTSEGHVPEKRSIISETNDEFEGDVSVTVDDLKEELNISSMQNVADSLKELLCSDEDLGDFFDDVILNYDNDEIERIFAILFEEINADLICALGSFILNMKREGDPNINRIYVKHLLIPKLFTDSSKQLTAIFIKFLENFLHTISEEFSYKLNDVTTEHPKYILNALNSLATKYKQQLLRDFMTNTTKLQQSHFAIIDALLYKDLEIETLQNAIKLLNIASSTYSDDNNFGKMLLNVVKCSGNDAIHFRQQLRTIVAVHQSIWKDKLEKEIGDCLQNNSMFSQSLRY